MASSEQRFARKDAKSGVAGGVEAMPGTARKRKRSWGKGINVSNPTGKGFGWGAGSGFDIRGDQRDVASARRVAGYRLRCDGG